MRRACTANGAVHSGVSVPIVVFGRLLCAIRELLGGGRERWYHGKGRCLRAWLGLCCRGGRVGDQHVEGLARPETERHGDVHAHAIRRCDQHHRAWRRALGYFDGKRRKLGVEVGDERRGLYARAYADFEDYVSGVYQPNTTEVIGGHAVRIVGWGTDGGVKYWKVANSWNPFWGEDGYFRIVRGTNEGGLEQNAVAAAANSTWGLMSAL